MAVTFTVTPRAVVSEGGLMAVYSEVSASGAPTVGGDALTATALGVSQMISVDPLGAATIAAGTSGLVVAALHPSTQVVSQVLIVFYVQGTAGAANAMVATTVTLASHIFRVKVMAKTATVGAPSIQ